jgi:YbgC/YbaW family acyl-CoA thioester hydrolase
VVDGARAVISHAVTVQVGWGDVDAAGIVFSPRFYAWYDHACEALFAAIGLDWPRVFARHGIVGVPIVESGSRFTSPARHGDTLTVRTSVAWVRERTFRAEHEVAAGDRLCAAGFEIRAWVRRSTAPDGRLEAVAIPDEVARRLRGDAE